MKFKNLLGLGIALLCLAACKKESPIIEPPIVKPDETEIIRDSVAYVMDGKLNTASKYSSGWKVSNVQPNSKVDSIVNYAYYISGDKDSVMYSKTYSFYKNSNKIDFIFIKKYNKKVMTSGFLYEPSDIRDFYAVGMRNYALDYERNNSQNGIAINVNNEGAYKTYGSDSFRIPPTLSADAQQNSKFEIISVKKTKTGLYILEARFNAKVYDDKNGSKRIDNGYLKINLGLLDEYFK
ncbi:hypothetical protein EZ449_00525 [Pedobacter frigidisoli]|uniref:Lipoprotein n=1 Tax=Pedobacter frigidisoli TaxID=2530455 RepID=A0A4V6N698_9SPHI|nr:hypothetical protein [Pedobacter frigidisoli]TCD12566.1 hypothetical protein EZ449_00525 [Pedobacter frigidisoli]